MTYFPDLSTYEYLTYIRDFEAEVGITSLNVGWLDGSMPYPTGVVSDEFKERLLEFCFDGNTVLHTTEFHSCNLGNCPIEIVPEQRGNNVAYFSFSEIRVIGKLAIYAAPTLIYHYVVVHNYKPPDEFIEAVLISSGPNSHEHKRLRALLEE